MSSSRSAGGGGRGRDGRWDGPGSCDGWLWYPAGAGPLGARLLNSTLGPGSCDWLNKLPLLRNVTKSKQDSQFDFDEMRKLYIILKLTYCAFLRYWINLQPGPPNMMKWRWGKSSGWNWKDRKEDHDRGRKGDRATVRLTDCFFSFLAQKINNWDSNISLSPLFDFENKEKTNLRVDCKPTSCFRLITDFWMCVSISTYYLIMA